MTTYLFYDLETTGADPVFDQVCQFAAIRTDESLNELAAYERFVRLRPDVIPSPVALARTRRSINDILDGEPEYEVIRDIHALVNEPGTISIGYNSLDFDDDFLRFSFYRNLLSPYDHHSRRGCGRADLLSLVVLYYHFAPDLLTWPVDEKGPTLRLEAMSKANGCADGQAHDAMADVRATLNLARRMYALHDVWHEGMRYFDGQNFDAILDKLPVVQSLDGGNYRRGVMLRHKFGSAKNYVAPVLFLCRSEPYSNTTWWLRLDKADLPTRMMANEWDALLTRKTKVDQLIVRPPISPRVSPEAATQTKVNLEWLISEPTYLPGLRNHAHHFKWPPVANVDPDASLYPRGFRSWQENAECQAFLSCSSHQRVTLLGHFSSSIDRTLATRLLARNYDVCDDDPEYQDYLLRARGEGSCVDYRGRGKRTRQHALAELAEHEQSAEWDDKQNAILAELREWIQDLDY